jgi:ABC-2 type transport system permease protein
VHGEVSVGDVRGTGVLGVRRFKASIGHFRLDRTGTLRLDTSAARVTVDTIVGNAEIPGGHVLLRFADLRDLEAAARTVGEASRDSDALAVRVPHDGSTTSLKALLDRFDEYAVPVDSLSMHTPRPRRRVPRPHRRRRQHEGGRTMSTATLALTDSATMLRRNLRRMLRYPSMTVLLVGMPIVFLLLFVYVLGGALGAGIGGPSGGRAEYVNYVTPAIILMTIASAVQGTSISVAMDMTEGIVDRFRTMAIARLSVLTGHVVGSVIQAMLGITAVIGVALVIGFRPSASLGDWFALAGVLVLMAFAFVWLSVALDLASDSVEVASNVGMPLGAPIGANAAIAVGWCVLIALGGYLWAKKLFNCQSAR